MITRPPLRWLGSKWKIGSWIIEQFPPHLAYVEPYGGGASVLLRKLPSTIEVLNDLNSDIVNFFDVLRSTPDALIRAIELTPFSREIHRRAAEPTNDPLEKALRLYVRCWQSFQPASGDDDSGWRFQRTDNRGKSVVSDWNDLESLWAVAARLKAVQLEHDDALAVIARYDGPETLFYVDPPYLVDVRSSSNTVLYGHEMTNDDHVRLAEILKGLQGMAIVSGYPHPFYDELYRGWRTVTRTTTTNAGGRRTECLWVSPNADEIRHYPLFATRKE